MSSLAWNVDPLDYNRPGTDAIISVVNGATTNGSIVLLHDGGGDRSQTFEALDTIIPYLQSLYDLVPVPPFWISLGSRGGVCAALDALAQVVLLREARGCARRP